MKDIDLNSNNLVSAIDVAQSEISKILELSK
jgi:plasmid maintenance system antidote protein VapI